MGKIMADLNDLFKVLSEGKKASIESNPGATAFAPTTPSVIVDIHQINL